MEHDIQFYTRIILSAIGIIVIPCFLIIILFLFLRKIGVVRGGFYVESMSEKKLILKMFLSTKRIRLGWDRIQAFTPTYYGNCSLKNYKVLLLQVDSGEYYNIFCRIPSEKLLQEIHRFYSKEFCLNNQDITGYQFQHPEIWRKKFKQLINGNIFVGCWGIVVASLFIEFYKYVDTIFLILISCVFAVVLLLLFLKTKSTLRKIRRKRTLISSLICSNNFLSGKFSDGESFGYLLDDVVSCNLEPSCGKLYFRDGGMLTDLEKLTNWFALYNYLKTKLSKHVVVPLDG